MRPAELGDIPPQRQAALRKAVRLEWLTLAYLGSVVVLMYLVMGSSQAMKTAWVEDVLSLVPVVSFLVSNRFVNRAANKHYPYGYFGVISIAFIAASVALVVVGGYLLYESVLKLVTAHHPTIGTIEVFGEPVWLGWLMFPVLAYASIPIVFIGRAKASLARQIFDKTLYVDGRMNRADWLTGLGAAIGVLGIALGLWWADALAAGLIALDIIRDGVGQFRAGITGILDRAPEIIDGSRLDPLPARIETEWKKLDWVEDAEVRLRESGHVFFGEGFIRPVDRRQVIERAQEARQLAYGLDWRLRDLVVQIIRPEDGEPDQA